MVRLWPLAGLDIQKLTTLSRSLLARSSAGARFKALANAANASSVGAKTVMAAELSSSVLTSPAA